MIATLRWWLVMVEFDYEERYWEHVSLSERWLALMAGDGR